MRGRLISAMVVGVLLGGAAAAQTDRSPATLDDLLAELRGMRAEINRAASASMRTELVTARLLLQEIRLSTVADRLASVRQQLADSRLRLAPSTDQIKPALETSSEILAPLRYTVQQEQRRSRELRQEEAELTRLIEAEESRWSEFDARLDELERTLGNAR